MTGSSAAKPRGLIAHRDFRYLWSGDALGQLGAQFTIIALPVLAVATLHASEWQMGLLTAANTAMFLVIGLPTGALVDRMRKRNVLIVTDLIRAGVLAMVTVAAVLGVASMPVLYIGALVISAASVFFDVAHQSYVPALVGMDHVVEGNAKLQATASVAVVAGPATAGQLLRIITAPWVIGVNAVTYTLSAVLVARIRHRETPTPAGERGPLIHEIRDGLAFVFHQPLLLRMVACTGLSNLSSGIAAALETIYILRVLGLTPAAMGMVFSVGAIGGLLGAVLAERAATRLGPARVIPISATAMALGFCLVPLANTLPFPPQITLICALGNMYLWVVIYNVATVSFRQRLCPPPLLGRMNASVRFLVWGTAPIGGLLGGWLGTWIGVVPGLWVAAVGGVLAAAPVVFSQLTRMTQLPTAASGTGGVLPPGAAPDGESPQSAGPPQSAGAPGDGQAR